MAAPAAPHTSLSPSLCPPPPRPPPTPPSRWACQTSNMPRTASSWARSASRVRGGARLRVCVVLGGVVGLGWWGSARAGLAPAALRPFQRPGCRRAADPTPAHPPHPPAPSTPAACDFGEEPQADRVPRGRARPGGALHQRRAPGAQGHGGAARHGAGHGHAAARDGRRDECVAAPAAGQGSTCAWAAAWQRSSFSVRGWAHGLGGPDEVGRRCRRRTCPAAAAVPPAAAHRPAASHACTALSASPSLLYACRREGCDDRRQQRPGAGHAAGPRHGHPLRHERPHRNGVLLQCWAAPAAAAGCAAGRLP